MAKRCSKCGQPITQMQPITRLGDTYYHTGCTHFLTAEEKAAAETPNPTSSGGNSRWGGFQNAAVLFGTAARHP